MRRFWRRDSTDQQLKRFSEHVGTSISIKSISGEYITISDMDRSRLALDVEKVPSATPDGLYPRRTAQLIDEHDTQLIKAKKTLVKDIPLYLNGQEYVYRVTKFPIFSTSNEVIGIGSLAEDITGQAGTKSRLLESEAKYRELFDQAPIPFVEEDWSNVLRKLNELRDAGVTDFAAHFRANPASVDELYDACEQLGASERIARMYRAKDTKHFMDTLTHSHAAPDELKGFSNALVALFAGELSFSYEAQETALDGQPMSNRIMVSIPEKFSKNWERVLISTEDLTTEKELERRADEARIFETIGKLSGGVAHDFNNLLSIIRGGAELLDIEGVLDRNLTQEIITATKHGAHLTNSLLAYARQQNLQPQIVDLDGLIEEMQPLLRRAVGSQTKIAFRSNCFGWMARVDPARFKDAVLNLVLNAFEAKPVNNEIDVYLYWTNRLPEGASFQETFPTGHALILDVRDTGTGMTPDVKERALEPFYSTKQIGSGLGLSSVLGFTKQSGGTVAIESEIGNGTRVSLILPAVKNPQETHTNLRKPEEMRGGGGQRILVVEDDPSVRRIVEQQLLALGYVVTTVENADQALTLTNNSDNFDLAISDIVLPGQTSGIELADQLRTSHENLPILLMTGYDPSGSEVDDYPKGRFAIMQKPFDITELAQHVSSCLKLGVTSN